MKLLFTLSTVLICNSLFSQSNLQFNKVKLIGATPDTVPIGKIWKVESAIYNGEIANIGGIPNPSIQTNVAYIYLNNETISIRKSSTMSWGLATSIIWEQQFPIWLPAGTILQTGNNVLYLSVLEFNQ
jgi:hypothetical protein